MQLQKHRVEPEIIQIGRKHVRMCINSGTCRQNEGKGCVFDDDAYSEMAQKMAKYDTLIKGTPVCYGQPNGDVLSLMQRPFSSLGRFVQDKPAANVAVYRLGGATPT